MFSNHKTPLSQEDFLRKISMLPVVQELIREQSQQAVASSIEARNACIASLKALREEEAASQKAVDDAEQCYQKELAKIEKFRSACAASESKHRETSAARQACENELVHVHGEKHVMQVLHILPLLINECRQKITNATAGLSTSVYENGEFVGFRKVSPQLKQFISEKKAELVKLEEIYTASLTLIESEIPPATLEQKCSEFLTAVGYKSAQVEQVEENAATQ